MTSLKDIAKGDEDQRREKIIDISRNKDKKFIPQLIARLKSSETIENKRHIVRALGNIGDDSCSSLLIALLSTEEGLILGDVAEALGKLRNEEAKEKLVELAQHKIPFVVEKATWAIKQLK